MNSQTISQVSVNLHTIVILINKYKGQVLAIKPEHRKQALNICVVLDDMEKKLTHVLNVMSEDGKQEPHIEALLFRSFHAYLTAFRTYAICVGILNNMKKADKLDAQIVEQFAIAASLLMIG